MPLRMRRGHCRIFMLCVSVKIKFLACERYLMDLYCIVLYFFFFFINKNFQQNVMVVPQFVK